MRIAIWALSVLFALVSLELTPSPRRIMERLGRGVVALRVDQNKVFVSWRILATDPANVAFNLYRQVGDREPVKINKKPIKVTNFLDDSVDFGRPVSYFVRTVIDGEEKTTSELSKLPADAPIRQYLSIKLKPLIVPREVEGIEAIGIGDLNGDGEYDFVVLRPRGPKVGSQVYPSPTTFRLEAYLRDGTFLWRMNLGWNIELGRTYAPFVVYDLDSDGRAEVVIKTAEGTVFADGKRIGDTNGDGRTDYRNKSGTVLEGPEFLSVIDGLTGKELARAPWIARGRVSDWGDNYGNRASANKLAIAYLDGIHPSIIIFRGIYALMKVEAWDYRNGKLVKRWSWSNEKLPKEWWGQGFHYVRVGDVDNDGRDEILHGCILIDENGKEVYTTKLGHGDRFELGDIDPDRPGLEVFACHEHPPTYGRYGVELHCARTGEILWGPPESTTGDVGRAVSADIDPRYKGEECWAAGGGARWLFSSKGEVILSWPEKRLPPCNLAIWWDGDLMRELLDIHRHQQVAVIEKWNWESGETENLLTVPAQGAYNAPLAYADILGDWREELLIYANGEIRIYVTTIPTPYHFCTLMHDPLYRLDVAAQTGARMKVPHTSFYLGEGMELYPPKPKIALPTLRK